MSVILIEPPAGVLERLRQPDETPAGRYDFLVKQPRVAVLIPCRNEEVAIRKVVADFRKALPAAVLYVYDNNSTDQTIREARAAGAIVRNERLQGKGHVVRRMFADIEADVYVLVDGDDTYDANAAPAMLALLVEQQLDMVCAGRLASEHEAYRLGHRLGNTILSTMVAWVFGGGISDLLSGYRVFSRRFVKSFPALATGFETETEFTIHALALRMPVGEVHASYRARAAGSRSKLNTVLDGVRILRAILSMIQNERPLQVFSFFSLVYAAVGLGLGTPLFIEFLHTGLVPRVPSAVLSTGLVLLASSSMYCGMILDAVARGRKESKRLEYLKIPPLDVWE